MFNNVLVEKLNNRLFENNPTPLMLLQPRIFLKLECCQKTGSVKDRFVFSAVKKAMRTGELDSNTTLVEATSGNTGISLAAAGAALGLSVKIVMPSNMSEERKQMMIRYGAVIIEVGPSDFTAAIIKRNEIIATEEMHWSPMQFENRHNIEVHRDITGPEISNDLKGLFSINSWDFVSGTGTGGTLMGLHEYFKIRTAHYGYNHRVVQVAPAEDAKSHGIQGINDGSDFLFDRSADPDQIRVSTLDAIQAAKDFARSHGILVGISSGANIIAAKQYADQYPDRNVVTLLCDRGERYFSVYDQV